MKTLSQQKDFKDSVKKSMEMMKDPARAAEAEAKYEHMMKVGNKELKEGAANVMEDAMAAMANPEVMAEMAKMIKDPSFQQQLQEMAKDPSFKNYVDAVRSLEVCSAAFFGSLDTVKCNKTVLTTLSTLIQMQDMMKDPAQKKKLEALGEAMRSSM